MSITFFYQYQPAAWIRVTGEDASFFLQSQFSNDLQRENPQPVIYGLWLTRKGKTIADSFIFQTDENRYLLFSYFCPARSILDKLEENIIADEVELEDLTSTVAAISCWGKNAAFFLHQIGLNEPSTGSFGELSGKYLIHGRRSTQDNYDLILPIAQIEAIKSQIEAFGDSEAVSWASDEDLHCERLKSCIPAIPNDIGPDDLPQEGALEIDTISFDKGCFLGQEVMARLHSMGQVQRKIYSIHGEIPIPPTLPCDLYDQESVVGQLCSAAYDGKSWIGHALLKKRSVENLSGLSLEPNDTPVVFFNKNQKKENP